MFSLFAFVGMTALLIFEGWRILGVLGLHKGSLKIMLSLPVAALSSTFLLLLYTTLGITFTATGILRGHILIAGITLLWNQKRPIKLPTAPNETPKKPLLIICSILLIITAGYGAAHSLLLPTFHYDSAVNWNMRSQVSFTEGELVLTESHELIRKPHYPFLYHSLQITTQQGQREWNDRAANAIHFLLSLSALAALFLIIRSLKGTTTSLLAITLIVTTPLFAMHLGGGYADIPLTLFALLSLATFFLHMKEGGVRWLLISAVFVSACVWTKSEGIPFCLVPWVLMLAFHIRKNPSTKRTDIFGGALAIALSALWPIFALAKGLPLSPHGSGDLGIGLQEGAIPEALSIIFYGGSFGVVLPLTFLCALYALLKTNGHKEYRYGLLWGLLSLGAILFVYLFTDNSVYLLNGQSFDRQLLLPVSLLILSLVPILTPRKP